MAHHRLFVVMLVVVLVSSLHHTAEVAGRSLCLDPNSIKVPVTIMNNGPYAATGANATVDKFAEVCIPTDTFSPMWRGVVAFDPQGWGFISTVKISSSPIKAGTADVFTFIVEFNAINYTCGATFVDQRGFMNASCNPCSFYDPQIACAYYGQGK